MVVAAVKVQVRGHTGVEIVLEQVVPLLFEVVDRLVTLPRRQAFVQ